MICATNAFGMGVDKPNVRTVRARQRARRRSRPTTRRPAAPGATARPRGRCCSPRTATRRCTCTSSSATRSTRACPAGSPTGSPRRPTATGATRSTRASWRGDLRGDGDRLRALVGHLTRAGVISPTPSAPDRVAGRVLGALRPRAPRRSAGPRWRRAARTRWRQYREIWAYVEERRLPAPGDPAPLRRLRAAAARRGRALLRRLRRRARARRCRRPTRRRSADLDDAIVSVAPRRRPAVGPHHLRRDPPRRAHEEDRAQLLRRPARLRQLRRTCAAPTSSRAWTS